MERYELRTKGTDKLICVVEAASAISARLFGTRNFATTFGREVELPPDDGGLRESWKFAHPGWTDEQLNLATYGMAHVPTEPPAIIVSETGQAEGAESIAALGRAKRREGRRIHITAEVKREKDEAEAAALLKIREAEVKAADADEPDPDRKQLEESVRNAHPDFTPEQVRFYLDG